MKKLSIIIILIFHTIFVSSQESKCLYEYTEDNMHSNILEETRTLLIYTPLGYNVSHTYPVLYVLDGEYTFDYAVSMTKYLYECDLIPQMIVVGVKNVNRNRDFLPSFDFHIPESGGADKFAKCLVTEIVPFIDSKLRTSGYNILYGHSYGGLFTQYIFANYTDKFNSYIAASPSVYWKDHIVINQIDKLNPKFEKLIYDYFSMGSYERKQMANGTSMLDSVLKSKKIEDLRFKYEFMQGEDHASTRLKTLNNGLEFSFKKWYYLYSNNKSNWCLDSLNDYYNKLSDKIGVKIPAPESTYYYFGYHYLQQGNREEALKTFIEANNIYPESPKSYTNLATAYERIGDKTNALKYYKKALDKTEIEDPFYKEIQLKIEKIKKDGVSNSCPI